MNYNKKNPQLAPQIWRKVTYPKGEPGGIKIERYLEQREDGGKVFQGGGC